jgi:hypothetical protein
MTNATDNQLELGFTGIRPRANAVRREGRIARAGWWFSQMRDIVSARWKPPASRGRSKSGFLAPTAK